MIEKNWALKEPGIRSMDVASGQYGHHPSTLILKCHLTIQFLIIIPLNLSERLLQPQDIPYQNL
jgi:hypothetical protein